MLLHIRISIHYGASVLAIDPLNVNQLSTDCMAVTLDWTLVDDNDRDNADAEADNFMTVWGHYYS